jgi:hypothetical protein
MYDRIRLSTATLFDRGPEWGMKTKAVSQKEVDDASRE